MVQSMLCSREGSFPTKICLFSLDSVCSWTIFSWSSYLFMADPPKLFRREVLFFFNCRLSLLHLPVEMSMSIFILDMHPLQPYSTILVDHQFRWLKIIRNINSFKGFIPKNTWLNYVPYLKLLERKRVGLMLLQNIW